jgi:putative endonuclease
MEERTFYVYILTNWNNQVLYLGVTNNINRRIWEHKQKQIEGFTKKYNITKLVYAEPFATAADAITREKQLKGGSRQKKIDLVNDFNPEWKDLYNDL